ncbi:23S rRNA (uracil(1939)-C(5))-methyltransferase RlmD [soil metagenome]
MFDYHTELTLTIGSLTNLGQGVARTTTPDGSEGWVVFVPFTVPGESVRARIYRNHKHHSEADLLEVLEPSPHRIAPPCPLFGTCGGCQYQHIDYPRQLEIKREQLADLIVRMAKLPPEDVPEVAPVVPSPRTYGYRSKITPHFQKPKKDRDVDKDPPAIGFLRHGARQRVLDVPQCPIASPAINAALPGVRRAVFDNIRSYKNGATLLLRDSAGGRVQTDPNEVTTEVVGPFTFQFLARDFFQNNPSILPAFTGHVADQASASGNRFLVDAYCGSGLFGLTAASRFESVAGVEISESSADWARHNARANGIGNATFHAASADAIFAETPFPAAATSVIVDPPRRGCDAAFLAQLFAFGPSRVVYISCNPATQMRDLADFHAAGYRPLTIQPFDLFPQTRHLECVLTLGY